MYRQGGFEGRVNYMNNMGSSNADTKVFVSGLNYQTQSDGLRRYFSQFGNIKEAVVIMDRQTGLSKGYGFVTFTDAEYAQRACFDPSPVIDGRRTTCNLASRGGSPFRSSHHSFYYHPYANSFNPHSNISPLPPTAYPFNPHRNISPLPPTVYPWNTYTSPSFNQRGFYGDEFMMNTNTNIPFPLLVLAKNLENKDKEKNFVFSPASIQLALSLVASGSTGSTLKEFLTFLEAEDLKQLNSVATKLIGILTNTTQGGPKLSFVGGVWVDQSLSLVPTFQAKAESIYRAKAESVDFVKNGKMVVEEINRWAREATNGLIKSILHPSSGPQLRAVLANAIYFKGTWSEKFEKNYTREFPFYLADERGSVLVPFMTNCNEQEISTYNGFKVLRLPYENRRNSKASLSMYIILPNQVNGIWNLIQKVGSDPSFLKTHLRPSEKVAVRQFRIPKFKIEVEFHPVEDLQNVGLKLPFENGAEFGEMVKGGGFKVDDVIHKAYMEVNEEGTEAAAVTVVTMIAMSSGRSPPTPTLDFVADHPFMFIVRDDYSGMILFMGHVSNPSL